MAIAFDIEDRPLADGLHLVRVTGEIDLFTAPEFKQRISAAIDGGASSVLVDLSQTTFIDSSSLGVLIGAHRRLDHRRGGLIIACDNPAVLKTFKVTGLDHVFTIVPSVEVAVDDAVRTG